MEQRVSSCSTVESYHWTLIVWHTQMWQHFQNLIWYKGYIQLYMNLLYVSKEIPREIYVLFLLNLDKAYLPGTEVNHDHEGGSSRVRLFHCTLVWLTPTITPNVGNLSAQFLLVGDCACALPQFYQWKNKTILVELARRCSYNCSFFRGPASAVIEIVCNVSTIYHISIMYFVTPIINFIRWHSILS